MDQVRPKVVTPHIQAGRAEPTSTEVTVNFNHPFTQPPVVVITGASDRAGLGAGSDGTFITAIGQESFTAATTYYSASGYTPYYIDWIAIGPIDGRPSADTWE